VSSLPTANYQKLLFGYGLDGIDNRR
jgi:hypothetical protein